MDGVEKAEQRVAVSLAEVKNAVRAAGLTFVETNKFVMGAGIAVGWTENFYAMLSIANFLENQLNITYGVQRDISADRLAVLNLCNIHNQNLTAYPVYLHDAEAGWDILMQNVLPMQVLRDAPEFVFGYYLRGESVVVDELRQKIVQVELGGHAYAWNEGDVNRLLARSLL